MILIKGLEKNKGFILLKGGRLYEPFLSIDKKNDILIKDDVIVKINKSIKEEKNYKVINCDNNIITNGFLDLHVHFREPGFEFKETIKTGSISAFYGGFTRVCTMPNTDPVIDSPELIKFIIEESQDTPVYIHPIGAITKGQKGLEISEIGEMVEAGAVAISDDGIPVKNSQVLRFALEYAKKFNIPVINHAEDNCLVNDGLMHEGKMSTKLGLPGNPDIAESSMVYRDLAISEYVGGRLHVPHVSSFKSLEIIKIFRDKGVDVTAEVTPHHLSLTDSILRNYDTNAKVAPPIRSSKDQKALIDAIKSGLIDCIATDHAPHANEDKDRDFKHASCGMIGLESAFGIVNKTLAAEKVDITDIIDLFTVKPSRVMNIIPNVIKEGNIAEINIIDPVCKWIFDQNSIKSKSNNSALLDREMFGKVLYSMNKGYILNCKV
ncbi:MAG: dihydroorotase [Candidatus Marinimicrobia bacterium]|nr:dihydroorotase [Candidatus Neomarinimicrobiota bacterium]|tara:strand:- start:9483 stop:10790 length:1308 start_codon:yes stop_codon:yes gene_type:complete